MIRTYFYDNIFIKKNCGDKRVRKEIASFGLRAASIGRSYSICFVSYKLSHAQCTNYFTPDDSTFTKPYIM